MKQDIKMDKKLSPLLLLLVPILAAPVGVPIMGYCAVQQIRHSAGRIYGLGLAMFSLLFFPLLLLDGLIVAGFMFGLLLIVRSAQVSYFYYPWHEFLWIVGVLPFVVAGLVDYAIIQAAWRSAKRMPDDPAIPAAGSHPSFFSSRAWKAASLIVAVSFVVGIIALLNQMHPLGVRRVTRDATPAISVQPANEPLAPPPEADVLRVKLHQAEADLARVQKLYEAKLVSQDDYDAIKSDRDVLAAEVAGNKAEIARLQIERADQKFAQTQELYQRKLVGQQEFEEAKAARDLQLAQAGVPSEVVGEYNALRTALVSKRNELVEAMLHYPPGSIFVKEVTNSIAEFSQRKQRLENEYPLLASLSPSSSANSSEMARKADRILEAQQTHSNLMARYDAAMGITDFTSKDRALGALARDAGRAGDGDALQKSLRQITDFTVRDSAASEAARLLTKSGGMGPALDAARLITDFTIRDRTLAALATEAAAAGDAKTVKEMLRIITDFTVRDQAAVESARALAKAGLLGPAMEVAKTITDFTRRDQILSELAK
jgi:hypothetical protein